MKCLAVFLLLCGAAYADTVSIMPEYIEQMGYKVSQPMPCNWDPSRTTIFGYYGNATRQAPSTPTMIRSQRAPAPNDNLFQKDLELPTETAFGLNLNLEFIPEHMSHNGMQLQRVDIDYKPLNKRCPAGFGSGLMTR